MFREILVHVYEPVMLISMPETDSNDRHRPYNPPQNETAGKPSDYLKLNPLTTAIST